jgi:tRNA threonylcarbamoyladenosine biosynthesis protein TsaE
MAKQQTVSLNDIPKLAKYVAKNLKGGEIYGLIGNLAAGKTTFVKALAKELKIKARVTSPTFVLLNSFVGKLATKEKVFLYHLDLYRTKSFKEVKALGLTEFWGKPGTLTVIEWADKIKKYLPAEAKIINFKG